MSRRPLLAWWRARASAAGEEGRHRAEGKGEAQHARLDRGALLADPFEPRAEVCGLQLAPIAHDDHGQVGEEGVEAFPGGETTNS